LGGAGLIAADFQKPLIERLLHCNISFGVHQSLTHPCPSRGGDAHAEAKTSALHRRQL